MFHFTIEPDVLTRSWVAYTLRDASGAVQFIGCCRFTQLPSVPDARANKMFSKVFPDGRPMTITVLNIVGDRRAAMNAVWQEVQKIGRPMMLQFGNTLTRRAQPVMCDQTGEIWPSARAAATAHGLTPSALSNHLARKAGFATVRGKTYKYGPQGGQTMRPVIGAFEIIPPTKD